MDEWLDFPDLADAVTELIDIGLFEKARELLVQYEDTYKDESEIYLLFARLSSEENKHETAIDYLKQCYSLDKGNLDCLLGLFYSYTQLHNIRKGGRYLFRALRLYPNYEIVHTSLIWYYAETGKFPKALEAYEKAVSLGSENPETYRNGGMVYTRLGNLEDAKTCFLKALALGPTFDEARDNLADVYLMAGEPELAVSLYQEYLVKKPNDIKSLSRLVYCLCQNEKNDEAIALAGQTIIRYPNSPVGHVDLAYIYLNKEDYPNARASVDKALDISPIDAEAHRVKALITSEQGEVTTARELFTKAISLDPENAEIKRDYYHFLRTSGDHASMQKVVEEVIAAEQPYCSEEYWFLADFHREHGDNSRAFAYLHQAYRLMPGETELLPPMIDIMLDERHSSFANPLLVRYVARNGWNDTMNLFASHKRLSGQFSQEGLRLLRYFGERPAAFGNYLYLYYLKRFGAIGAIALTTMGTLAGIFFFGLKGLLAGTSFIIAAVLTILVRLWIKRKKIGA